MLAMRYPVDTYEYLLVFQFPVYKPREILQTDRGEVTRNSWQGLE